MADQHRMACPLQRFFGEIGVIEVGGVNQQGAVGQWVGSHAPTIPPGLVEDLSRFLLAWVLW